MGLDSWRDRDAWMQRGTKSGRGALAGGHDRQERRRTEEAGGPLRSTALVWALDRLLGLEALGDGETGMAKPSLNLPPLAFSPDPAEFPKFSRRRRCCGHRVQLALLGLATILLWAGLLTLFLFWREDTPSPKRSPSCVPSQKPTVRPRGAQHSLWSPIFPLCLPPCPPSQTPSAHL